MKALTSSFLALVLTGSFLFSASAVEARPTTATKSVDSSWWKTKRPTKVKKNWAQGRSSMARAFAKVNKKGNRGKW